MSKLTVLNAYASSAKNASKYLLIATVCVGVSTQLLKLYLPVWIFEQDGNSQYISLVRIIEYLPLLILFYPMGIIIDYLSTRQIFILISVLVISGTISIFFVGKPTRALTPVALFLFFSGTSLFNSARLIVTKRCVSSDKLLACNVALGTLSQGLVVCGGAIGAIGLLISAYVDIPLLIVMLAFPVFVSALYLLDVKTGELGRAVGFLASLHAWWRNKLLLRTNFFTLLYNFADAILWFLYLYILAVLMKLPKTTIALVFAVGSVGCLFAYLVAKKIDLSPRSGFMLAVLLMVGSALMLAIQTDSVYGISTSVAMLAASNIIHSACLTNLRQKAISDSIAGRVNTWFNLVLRVGSVSGYIVAPTLLGVLTPESIALVAGLIGLFLYLICRVIYPRTQNFIYTS